MWDIKLAAANASAATAIAFHLNHVGYKDDYIFYKISPPFSFI